MTTIEEINAELKRTAFQKKAVVRFDPAEVLELARSYFSDHGYRATPSGRPGHLLVMGSREGILPRVNGEVAARLNVGRSGTTLVTVDAAGERLGPEMKSFLVWLRSESKTRKTPSVS